MIMTNKKIAVIGGDARMISAADVLAEAGFESAVFGADMTKGRHADNVTRCAAMEDAVTGAVACILPLPYSVDGIRINSTSGSSDIRLQKLFEQLTPNTLVCGGRLDSAADAYARRAGVKLVDYYLREEFCIANTAPTAEGAVAIAMNELPVTLCNSNVIVYGCGRVARTLALTLGALHAKVTVAARKSEDLVWAKINGFFPHYIYDIPTGHFDAVFNTVPAPVLTREILSAFDEGTLIVELSSRPGGIDMPAASELGMRVVWALSLPGKVAPVSAGRALGDCLLSILKENGVEP